MDFGVWGNSKVNMDQNDSQQQQQSEQQSSTQTTSNGNLSGPNGSNNGNGPSDNSGVVLMHHMEHTGVVCDICSTTICGFRYKCMQCPDFDLCHFCERKGHHAGHIMMRISFPEQAADAIRRYININGGSPTPRRPPPWCGTFPGNEHSPHFGGHRRGDRHSARRQSRSDRDSSPENAGDEPTSGHGCPYQMSKKGFRKWTKCMKKAAHHHRRSAEAYATSAARASTGASEGQSQGGAPAPAPNQFDFTAAASQIQEFLNAWGVPIDVVELYDEFGNRGQPTGAQQAASAAEKANNSNGTGDQNQNQTTVETPASTSTSAPSQTQTVLSDQLQQLNINNQGDSTINDTSREGPSVTTPPASAPTMDIDGEAGWTLIDKMADSSVVPGNVAPNVLEDLRNNRSVSFDIPEANAPVVPKAPGNEATQAEVKIGLQSPPSISPLISLGEPIRTPGTTPSGVPSNGMPMYPVLNAMQNPQFQQMMQGMTNAVGSAIRSIPIVPMGMGGFPRPQQPAPVLVPPPAPRNEESGNSIPELDAQSVTTLNQLLSMGFSNHDGWLARLVVAKKGDLEAVLNALFPGGAP